MKLPLALLALAACVFTRAVAAPPAHWDIAQTEMYDGPFHVPTPDAVVFEERWDKGERFRRGCVWRAETGR